jgi:hypothetical protein
MNRRACRVLLHFTWLWNDSVGRRCSLLVASAVANVAQLLGVTKMSGRHGLRTYES